MSTLLSFTPRARRSLQGRRHMGSITWGTRARGLGFVTAAGEVNDFNSAPMVALEVPGVSPGTVVQPLPNPDTRPGAWPGLAPGGAGTIQVSTLPAQVPVVVTPTSGTIPPPATVAAATAPVSWLEQSLIPGIANKWLLLGGVAAALFLRREKR